ncbi:elongation factor G-binding protein [Bacillus mangrovi]|uniref:Elongation factor G-binding protein n=1 Tax=Metabacillus mangrovi TaxID=1491830 RepID=A0A7X2S7C2_9BACI|nr:FusB/FusC family EF-G-binding protein [Metabacillus mangrovi]MTH55024.1 elongation factor G-binding protein [Metabacillus mangrovi]
MEPFIRTDQYHYIKSQAMHMVHSHSSANDKGVLRVVTDLAMEKVTGYGDWTEEQKIHLTPLTGIKDRGDAELFLNALKSYVIPFDEVSEAGLKKLFPKAKKLKLPDMEIDRKETTYLGWIDKNSGKMFIVAPYKGKRKGLQGTFSSLHKKGICTICNGHEEVGLFVTEIKGKEQGTFIKRGNYICSSSEACNRNLKSLQQLEDFVELMS